LSKAIYGLKEVPKTWYNQIDDYLINLGFECAVYVKSKGVEWRLSKARIKKNCKFVCTSKNRGIVLDIVFFVTGYKCT